MRKNLFLHIILILGLTSCNLNSKLLNNTEQKNIMKQKKLQIIFKKSKKLYPKILKNRNMII